MRLTTQIGATHVAQVTVNGKGLVTAVASVAITFPGTAGFSGTATVRNAAGTGTSSFVFVNGVKLQLQVKNNFVSKFK